MPRSVNGPTKPPAPVRKPQERRAVPAEPSRRDILQSIQDLSKRFDLLATTERVDALDSRLDVVEETLDRRLTLLEQRFNASDAHWKATSLSLGHLSVAFQNHTDNVGAHLPLSNMPTQAPDQQAHVWLSYHDMRLDRSWNHSAVVGAVGDVGMSASIVHPVRTPDVSLPMVATASSRISGKERPTSAGGSALK